MVIYSSFSSERENKKLDSILQFPKKLPGSFWGITTFFNPAKYKNKIENYQKFRESSKKQGLNLLCVELAFNNEPFELTKGDAEILIQVRSNSVMWQKERLLNIGLKKLPEDCDKVAWIDCDLIFKNDNWIEETCKLLEKYKVVQLFSYIAYLDKDYSEDRYNRIRFSGAYIIANLQNPDFFFGVPCGALAARKEIFDKYSFFDKSILGSNDSVMFQSFYGKNLYLKDKFTRQLRKELNGYVKDIFSIINGSFFYLNNIVLHLWHGDYLNRKYETREEIYHKYNFDPEKDLNINKDGCFEWASDKKELHKEVENYFLERKEEN